MNITIQVTGAVELERKLGKLGQSLVMMQSAMKTIGNDLSDYYAAEGFASQGGVFGAKWARLSPKYNLKKADRYPGRPMLIKTGKMQRSFQFRSNNTSAEIFNTAPYFVYHQSTELPRTKIPRRPTMGMNRALRNKVHDIVEKDIKDKIRRAGL